MTELARRSVLASLAGLPLATVLADPRLARAAAAGLDDVALTTRGGRTVQGALALPQAAQAPTVLLIHEWWGLNDQIKAVAADLAGQGYVALAVDLYDGKVASPGDRDAARGYMQAVVEDEASDTLVSWAAWLKAHEKGNGKIGTLGWCFGGGWSLNASIATPIDATVVYYGRVNRSAEDLKALNGPVLGHFATEDQWINKEMVETFEASMKAAGKTYENHWYEANHAFANPTSAAYDEPDAKQAWERTLAFLGSHL